MAAMARQMIPTIPQESEAAEPRQGTVPDQEEITALAHQFWLERGCPEGSPEVDWFRAEEELRGLTQS